MNNLSATNATYKCISDNALQYFYYHRRRCEWPVCGNEIGTLYTVRQLNRNVKIYKGNTVRRMGWFCFVCAVACGTWHIRCPHEKTMVISRQRHKYRSYTINKNPEMCWDSLVNCCYCMACVCIQFMWPATYRLCAVLQISQGTMHRCHTALMIDWYWPAWLDTHGNLDIHGTILGKSLS